MNKKEILEKVKDLGLPKGSYVVFGSCPMAAAGIRESSDIDLFVSQDVFEVLMTSAHWTSLKKSEFNTVLQKDVFEVCNNWDFGSYNPSLKELLSRATIERGVPFATLQDVRAWKEVSARPKDFVDIKLIDEYLDEQG